jgi:hypothetical protein
MGIDLGTAATFGSTCNLLGIDDQEMELNSARLSSAQLSSDIASRPLQDDQRNTSFKSLKALKSSRVPQNPGSPARDPDRSRRLTANPGYSHQSHLVSSFGKHLYDLIFLRTRNEAPTNPQTTSDLRTEKARIIQEAYRTWKNRGTKLNKSNLVQRLDHEHVRTHFSDARPTLFESVRRACLCAKLCGCIFGPSLKLFR